MPSPAGAYAVSFVELQRAATSLGGLAQELHGELAPLVGAVEDLLEAQWRGASADRFRGAWDTWHGAANSIIGALTALAGELARAAEGYETTETAVARTLA
jgi:WXG100 family type VII secretion target